MIYRVRTAEKTYHEGSPKVIPTLCDLGNWFAEVGRTPEATRKRKSMRDTLR